MAFSFLFRPLVLFSLSIILGILVNQEMPANILWVYYLLGLILLCCLAYTIFRKGLHKIILIYILLSGFIFGGIRMIWLSQSQSAISSAQESEIMASASGEVISVPRIDGDTLLFDLKVNSISYKSSSPKNIEEVVRVKCKLSEKSELANAHNLEYGDRVVSKLKLIRPPSPRNPGAFDYQQYLSRHQIYWLGEINGITNINIVSKADWWNLSAFFARSQVFLGNQISLLFEPDTAGLVRGMLLGDKREIDPDIEESYSEVGIAHILAVSGLHVAIIAAICYWILRIFRLTRERSSLIIIVVLIFYACLTGAGVPVVRAVIMSALVLLSVCLKIPRDAISFLGIAAVIQLLWNPYQLWEMGFELSYLITTALILYSGWMAERLPIRSDVLNKAVSVTLTAELFSFPVLVYHLNHFSLLSLVANLIFVPILSLLVVPLSLASLAASFISFEMASIISDLASSLLNFTNYVVDYLAHVRLLTFNFISPPWYWLTAYFIALYLFLRRFFLGAMLWVSLFVWLYFPIGMVEAAPSITFLDVGQGDAIIIETANRHVTMIDSGGTLNFNNDPQDAWRKKRKQFEVGKNVLLPYLRYRGINKIDELILTHGDADHISGSFSLAQELAVGRVIHNAQPPKSDLERNLLTGFKQRQVPIVLAGRGDVLDLSGAKLEFLHPAKKELSLKTNNNSLVTLLSINGVKILLTGDIEQSAEKELLNFLPSIDILKVAHHGSKSSTHEAFVKKINAGRAVISVGKKNRYGHPGAEVLARLQASGAKILRTDKNGAITYLFYEEGFREQSMVK